MKQKSFTGSKVAMAPSRMGSAEGSPVQSPRASHKKDKPVAKAGSKSKAGSGSVLQYTASYCSTLQHTAARCSPLQPTAAHCNTLQHTAAHSTFMSTAESGLVPIFKKKSDRYSNFNTKINLNPTLGTFYKSVSHVTHE